jgi:hypothetical protein
MNCSVGTIDNLSHWDVSLKNQGVKEMRYSEKEIEAMNPKALKELIEKEKKMKLSDAAKTIIARNKASPKEQELLERIREE